MRRTWRRARPRTISVHCSVYLQRIEPARLVSRYRPPVRIYAITPREEVARQFADSLWRVSPVLAPQVGSTDEMMAQMDALLVEHGVLKPGELVVFVAGQPPGRAGTTNLMKLHRIGQ